MTAGSVTTVRFLQRLVQIRNQSVQNHNVLFLRKCTCVLYTNVYYITLHLEIYQVRLFLIRYLPWPRKKRKQAQNMIRALPIPDIVPVSVSAVCSRLPVVLSCSAARRWESFPLYSLLDVDWWGAHAWRSVKEEKRERKKKRMNEWVSEWENENEWMNEWINKWMNEE